MDANEKVELIISEIEKRRSLAAQHEDMMYSCDADKDAKIYGHEFKVMDELLDFINGLNK